MYPPEATNATAPIAAIESGVYCGGSVVFDREGALYSACDPPGRSARIEVITADSAKKGRPERVLDLAPFGTGEELGDIALDSRGRLYAARFPTFENPAGVEPSVMVLDLTDPDRPAVDRVIGGSETRITSPLALALTPDDRLVVADQTSGSILVFASGAVGNVPPAIHAYTPESYSSIAVDAAGTLYVSDVGTNAISVYAKSGDQMPVRRLAGPATGLDFPVAAATDAAGNLYVISGSWVTAVQLFPAGADGNVEPRKSARSATGDVAIAP